jgi:hypothetical protein
VDVGAWQLRLEDTFGEGDIVGPHLLNVIALERECGRHVVSTFHGQSVLMDSFQSFFVETLRFAESWVAAHGWPEGADYYGAVLLSYLTVFRSFRACESLLLVGYPLDGFALLRDVKDRALLSAGIALNLTTWSEINSMDEGPRRRAEKKVYRSLLGDKSGIPEQDLEAIRLWESLFHQEVHGSKLTLVTEMSRLRSGAQLSVGPLPDDKQISMYMNRAVETGWLFTRLLPYLQPEPFAFGPRWRERRRILDDSFRVSEQALADMGKPIASALIRFADRHYTFGDDFHYVEADGTGRRDA